MDLYPPTEVQIWNPFSDSLQDNDCDSNFDPLVGSNDTSPLSSAPNSPGLARQDSDDDSDDGNHTQSQTNATAFQVLRSSWKRLEEMNTNSRESRKSRIRASRSSWFQITNDEKNEITLFEEIGPESRIDCGENLTTPKLTRQSNDIDGLPNVISPPNSRSPFQKETFHAYAHSMIISPLCSSSNNPNTTGTRATTDTTNNLAHSVDELINNDCRLRNQNCGEMESKNIHDWPLLYEAPEDEHKLFVARETNSHWLEEDPTFTEQHESYDDSTRDSLKQLLPKTITRSEEHAIISNREQSHDEDRTFQEHVLTVANTCSFSQSPQQPLQKSSCTDSEQAGCFSQPAKAANEKKSSFSEDSETIDKRFSQIQELDPSLDEELKDLSMIYGTQRDEDVPSSLPSNHRVSNSICYEVLDSLEASLNWDGKFEGNQTDKQKQHHWETFSPDQSGHVEKDRGTGSEDNIPWLVSNDTTLSEVSQELKKEKLLNFSSESCKSESSSRPLLSTYINLDKKHNHSLSESKVNTSSSIDAHINSFLNNDSEFNFSQDKSDTCCTNSTICQEPTISCEENDFGIGVHFSGDSTPYNFPASANEPVNKSCREGRLHSETVNHGGDDRKNCALFAEGFVFGQKTSSNNRSKDSISLLSKDDFPFDSSFQINSKSYKPMESSERRREYLSSAGIESQNLSFPMRKENKKSKMIVDLSGSSTDEGHSISDEIPLMPSSRSNPFGMTGQNHKNRRQKRPGSRNPSAIKKALVHRNRWYRDKGLHRKNEISKGEMLDEAPELARDDPIAMFFAQPCLAVSKIEVDQFNTRGMRRSECSSGTESASVDSETVNDRHSTDDLLHLNSENRSLANLSQPEIQSVQGLRRPLHQKSDCSPSYRSFPVIQERSFGSSLSDAANSSFPPIFWSVDEEIMKRKILRKEGRGYRLSVAERIASGLLSNESDQTFGSESRSRSNDGRPNLHFHLQDRTSSSPSGPESRARKHLGFFDRKTYTIRQSAKRKVTKYDRVSWNSVNEDPFDCLPEPPAVRRLNNGSELGLLPKKERNLEAPGLRAFPENNELQPQVTYAQLNLSGESVKEIFEVLPASNLFTEPVCLRSSSVAGSYADDDTDSSESTRSYSSSDSLQLSDEVGQSEVTTVGLLHELDEMVRDLDETLELNEELSIKGESLKIQTSTELEPSSPIVNHLETSCSLALSDEDGVVDSTKVASSQILTEEPKVPLLVITIDNDIGIAKGDTMISLLNDNGNREADDGESLSQWSKRVNEAIWRCRTLRKSCESKSVAGKVEHDSPGKRPKVMVDVDDVRVLGGVDSIGATQAAVLDHLKRDDFDDALVLYDSILVVYTEYATDVECTEPSALRYQLYVATALHNIGIIHMLNRNHQDAFTFFERATMIRAGILGAGHPDHIASLVKLSTCLFALENFPVAHSTLEEAAALCSKTFADISDHRQFGEILNNLGCLSYMCGEIDTAKQLFRKSIDLLMAVSEDSLYMGSKHSCPTVSLNLSVSKANLGLLCLAINETTNSIAELELAVKDQLLLLRDAHPTLIATMEHLVVANVAANRQRRALQLLRRMLHMQTDAFGPADERSQVTRKKIHYLEQQGFTSNSTCASSETSS